MGNRSDLYEIVTIHFGFGKCFGCESMNIDLVGGVQCKCDSEKNTNWQTCVRFKTIKQSWVHVYECKMSRLHGMLYVLDVWWRRQVFNACYAHTIHAVYFCHMKFNKPIQICWHLFSCLRLIQTKWVPSRWMRDEKCKQNKTTTSNAHAPNTHEQHQCQANRITLC